MIFSSCISENYFTFFNSFRCNTKYHFSIDFNSYHYNIKLAIVQDANALGKRIRKGQAMLIDYFLQLC